MGFVLLLFAGLAFFGMVALFLALVSIPIVMALALVVAVLRLAVFFILLPFRILGWVFSMALGRPAAAR